jgi:hypothetical protein
MTEQEWLEGTDPAPMIEFLAGKLGARKARLWSCACVRRAWRFLTDPRSRKAVQTAERFADGRVGARALWNAASRADDACDESGVEWSSIHWDDIPTAAVTTAGSDEEIIDRVGNIAEVVARNVGLDPESGDIRLDLPEEKQEKTAQAGLLRDLIGNPFHPVGINPAWQTPAVVSLAQAAYDNRVLPAGTLELDRLAILADALEEAGCDSADILNHLRQPGEHVRGCWAVDRLLGME